MAQIIERKTKANDGRATWLIRIYAGFDDHGKRKYISYNVTGTKKEAEREAARLEAKYHDGSLIESSHMTISEWIEEWLTVWAKQQVTERTYRDYEKILHDKIMPRLGRFTLSKAQNMAKAFQEAIDEVAKESGGRTGQYTHMILKQAMKKAVETRKMERNPLEFVQRPKAQKQQEIRPLDTGEIKTFLTTVSALWSMENGAPIYPLFKFMLDAGCRPGEALALKWSDLEDDYHTARIQRSLERTPDGWNEKAPKTAGSRRTISLTDSTAAILKRYAKIQKAHMMAHRDRYQDHDYVFANTNGQPMDKHNLVRRYFKPALEKAGLPNTVRLYDLRHTVATQLLKANINPKIVAERLGHANITMTLNTYSHVLPSMQQTAVKALEDMLGD